MLRNTFVFLPGIGVKTERALWRRQIATWSDFARSHRPMQLALPLGEDYRKNARTLQLLADAQAALDRNDARFFFSALPARELWRAYQDLNERFAFLDIETTGLSRYYNDITLIGVLNRGVYRVYIKGHNLASFAENIPEDAVLVTFNGSLFDLPFLRLKFPNIRIPDYHIDLRYLLRRVGVRGPLKHIEQRLGVRRATKVTGVTGFDATVLWSRYLRGDRSALRLLIQYNFYDTTSLPRLLRFAYTALSKQLVPQSLRRRVVAGGLPSVNARPTDDIFESLPTPPPRFPLILSDLLRRIEKSPRWQQRTPVVVGIDLTGSARRATGWARLQGNKVSTALPRTDEDILSATLEAEPDLVSIDSPLALPKTLPGATPRISRECERELRRRGVSVFWCLLPSMMSLTHRGIALARALRDKGLDVIESFPGAAQDILNIPRKKTSIEELKESLAAFGITGPYQNSQVTHDELDAITSALVGYFYLGDHYEALGSEVESHLIVPRAGA